MSNHSSDLREPLTGGESNNGGGDDDARSQSSQRSGASLLDRIRMQREREAAAVAAQQEVRPATIQVPQYSRVPNDASDPFSATASPPDHSGSGFFTTAWNTISDSMETGMASLQQDRGDLEHSDALLAPTTDDEDSYTMIGYFTTFVRDVYETFLNLPLWVRVIVIFALVYTMFKLM